MVLPHPQWSCPKSSAKPPAHPKSKIGNPVNPVKKRLGSNQISMETPLSPLEFARRARRFYANREAVVSGSQRWTYANFFARCDRWSAALQGLGVRQGDRVAYIAPSTHSHLEGYSAVPQIGAVLVPINYRLTADDFAYILNHSGARVVCVDGEYLELVDRVRTQVPGVEHFVALDGTRPGWLDYESSLNTAPSEWRRP